MDNMRNMLEFARLRPVDERVQETFTFYGVRVKMVDSIQLLRNIWQFDSVKRSGQSSSIDTWDVHQDCITENDKRHALIQHYIETGNSGKVRDVATALYYVLEAFLRGSYPAFFRLETAW